MAANGPGVSEAELQVLKVLWKHGPATVKDVNARLRRKRWAHNTVLTLLARLRDKGYVHSTREGVAHVYGATVTRDKLLKHRLKELTDQVCDGAASPLLSALVDGRRFSSEEIEHFRRLLDQMEQRDP